MICDFQTNKVYLAEGIKHYETVAYNLLSALYKDKAALHELSMDESGFEWINCISANENILVFLRISCSGSRTGE